MPATVILLDGTNNKANRVSRVSVSVSVSVRVRVRVVSVSVRV